jgi:hypothetical protein
VIVGVSVTVGVKVAIAVAVAVAVNVPVWLGVEVLVGTGVIMLAGVMVLVPTTPTCVVASRVCVGTRTPAAGVQLTSRATHKPRIQIRFVISQYVIKVQFSPES